MKEDFLEVKGLKIHYLVEGKGSPLLFLHGHRSDAKRWQNLIYKLAERKKVYAPDLPGFGKSDQLPGFHNMESYIPYLSGFIRKLGLDNFVLVGGSMGAVLSILLARKNPEKIKKIVLIGPIYDKNSFRIPRFKLVPCLLLLSFFPRSKALVRLFDHFIKSDRLFKPFLKRRFPKEAQTPQVLDYEVRQWRVMSIKVWAQTLYSLLTFSHKSKRKIKIPIFLVFPENDQYINISKTVKSFKKVFPENEIVFLENLIHVPKGEISESFLNKFQHIFDKL